MYSVLSDRKECGMTEKNGESKKNNALKLNNSGSAIVVVIIAMAFIGILVSVLMYTALLNYQMKVNNLRAKDNFYSAESVLDEIRLGIQGEVSGAIGKSYQNILTNFDSANAEDKQFRMRYGFLSQIQKDYMVDENDPVYVNTYDLKKLYGYLYSTKEGTVLETTYNGDTYTMEQITVDGSEVILKKKNGLEVTDDTTPLIGAMILYEDGLVLKNLKVTYTDASGYVSIISTDLRISVPDMDFAEAVSLPSLTGYSIVAQKQILVYPEIHTGETAENTIAGSFYCGGLNVGSLASDTNLKPGCVTLRLKEDDTDYNSDKRMIVDGELLVGEKSRLTTDSYGELWAGSITMHGSGGTTDPDAYSSIVFGGNSVYVADDMKIYGDGNKLTAGGDAAGNNKGQYIGFGSGADAGASSSIIVNGINTDIDVSRLTNLTLAGNAYIGIGGTDDWGQSSSDIVMGQSIAVKSDQVAYLVPAECIGIDKETGKQVNTSITNPMTLDTYQTYIQRESGVYEVGDEIKCSALDNKTLRDFGIITTDSSRKAMFQRYVKQINSSLSLVYYYVMFDSNDSSSLQNANDYFAAYYNKNKSTLDAYTKLYTTGIVMRGDSDGFYTLHLAGNVVRYDSPDSLSLKNATASDDSINAGYAGLLTNSQKKYKALCKKLLDNYDQLGASEKADAANAYTNLVKETEIYNYFSEAAKDSTILNKSEAGYFTQASYTALVVDGDYEYTGTGSDNFKGLIIATGDVRVDADFEGTIISGGNITLARNVKVKPCREAVVQAMAAAKLVGGKTYSVTDFLAGGSGYLGTTGRTYSEETVDLGDLVGYENWEKR